MTAISGECALKNKSPYVSQTQCAPIGRNDDGTASRCVQLNEHPQPLNELLRSLVDTIDNATSSAGLLLETERAIAARRTVIEQSCTATVIASRPNPGDVRPRDHSPPPPPPRESRRRRPHRSITTRRSPLGTITNIAGHESA